MRRAAGRQHRVRAEQHESRAAAAEAAAAVAAGRGGTPELYSPGGAEPGYVAPDPKDPDIFYAGGNNGSFLTRLDRRTGNLREVNPYPRMFSGEAVERRSSSAGSGPIRSSSRPPIRRVLYTVVAARLEDDERRRQRGIASAATSRGTIRRRWVIRAARSRTT